MKVIFYNGLKLEHLLVKQETQPLFHRDNIFIGHKVVYSWNYIILFSHYKI